MLKHPTLDLLGQLGLAGMAQAFTDLTSNDEAQGLGHAEWLALALDAAELVSALIWDALTGTLACRADKEMPTKASKHLGRMVSLDAERSTAYLAS
jgi:hypothetical protein